MPRRGNALADEQVGAINTDRELWRENDYYSDSVHVTEGGGIGINCSGLVIVKRCSGWHEAAIGYDALRVENAGLRDRLIPPVPTSVVITNARERIAALEAELAALRSAPASEEVSMCIEWLKLHAKMRQEDPAINDEFASAADLVAGLSSALAAVQADRESQRNELRVIRETYESALKVATTRAERAERTLLAVHATIIDAVDQGKWDIVADAALLARPYLDAAQAPEQEGGG